MINDSKISYLMFLHGYLLACEISTVRTQTSISDIKEMNYLKAVFVHKDSCDLKPNDNVKPRN